MVTLDSNFIVYLLKKEASAEAAYGELLKQPQVIYVPTIVEHELFSLPSLSVQEALEIDSFLSTVIVIPLTSELARLSGELRGRFRLKTADSIIAATALFTHSTLVTRNTRDFKKIVGLSVQKV